MQDYKLTTYCDSEDHSSKAVDIAFQSGKDCCGLAFEKNLKLELWVYGKFSDAVRVYSALKNNHYIVALQRGTKDA